MQRFDSPVGTQAERDSGVIWPGAWRDLTGFGLNTVASYVTNNEAYHTGVDLNLPGYADSNAPVSAAADGEVVYAGTPSAGWGLVILLAHPRASVFTRYAHLRDGQVRAGVQVSRGQLIARVGDYRPLGTREGDHLHFDVPKRKIDPADWPGINLVRLLADYHDPAAWLRANRSDSNMADGDPRIDYERVYNVVNPSVTEARWLEIAREVFKLKQTLGMSWDDAGIGKLSKRKIIGWDYVKDRPAFEAFVKQYYPGATLTWAGVGPAPTPTPTPDPKPDPKPEPTPVTPDFALGYHVMSNTNLAREEAGHGCKYFMVMDDFGGAGDLKRTHPGATVMVRRYFPQSFFLSPDQVIQGLEGAQHGALVYTGFNEADQGGQDGEELRTRARIDIAVARKIKERNPGATYAVGSFSMGTPDFTNPDTCRIIREEYAPHYNSGLIAIDMHLYSPNPGHIDKPAEWPWFERRWEFLFTKCGFDPRVRAVYCSENGLDQGGIGGFPAHGLSPDQVVDHCRKLINAQTAPLIVSGVSYPSPIRGAALFQLGGNGDKKWAGYDVNYSRAALRQLYGYRGLARDVITVGGES